MMVNVYVVRTRDSIRFGKRPVVRLDEVRETDEVFPERHAIDLPEGYHTAVSNIETTEVYDANGVHVPLIVNVDRCNLPVSISMLTSSDEWIRIPFAE